MGRTREIADLIGGTTPDIILKTSDGAILNLQTSDTTVTADSVLGAINFQAPDEASGTDSILIASKIEAVAEGTFAMIMQQNLYFQLVQVGEDPEKMSIASTGATTITTSGNETTLSLVSTDADASLGLVIDLHRNSSSPADDDAIGRIIFSGENDADEKVSLVQLIGLNSDVTDGTEDGRLQLFALKDGTSVNRFDIQPAETSFNDDSVDVDFRVESNSKTHMLFVDGGNNRVGIGTSTTSALLTVEGTGSYQATTNTSGLTITGATALQNAGKLKLSGAGTNLDHIEIDNDGGNLVIGLERSAGAGIIGSPFLRWGVWNSI